MSGDNSRSRDAAYFRQLYAGNADPWNFEHSEYERDKYAATVAALHGKRFESGLEVGCSIGVLTKLLAPCCGKLLGVDLVESALRQARRRCAGETHVSFQCLKIPVAWPAGTFDLIIFSEVLYFLDADDIALTAMLANTALRAGGIILLVNYTEPIDEPFSGEAAAEAFIKAAATLSLPLDHVRGTSFRIDVLGKREISGAF